ncbi:MAG: PAS domain S-box protein [Candidatus Zixiibacteriota bacterium]
MNVLAEKVLQVITDGYILIDMDGKILDVNPAYSSMVGFSRQELQKMNIRDLEVKFSRPETTRSIPQMLKEGNGRFVTIHRCRDGRIINLDMSFFIIIGSNKNRQIAAIVRPVGNPQGGGNVAYDQENLYLTLVMIVPDAVTVTDLEGNITFVSERTLELHGCISPHELLGKSAFDLIAPEDRQRAAENMQKTFTHGPIRNIEYCLLRLDGSRFIGELNASVIRDSEGQPKAFIATTRDITERKQAEKVLKESEEKFRTLADYSPNMIFINKTGRIVYVNRKCEEMMGYSKEEFLSEGFDFRTLIAPQSRDLVEAAFRKHKKGTEIAPYEYSLITKEGKIIDAIITTKLIQYDGDQAILGVATDISDRKRVEEALRKTAQQLKADREALREKNIALKQFLKAIEDERQNYKQRISQELRRIVLPILKRLRDNAESGQSKKLQMLEKRLQLILSKDIGVFQDHLAGLSPRELEVCKLLRNGMSSKQIANTLNVSLYTVHKHREQIRKKLGICNTKINLTTYLRTH